MACAVSMPSAFLFGINDAPLLLQFLSEEHAVTMAVNLESNFRILIVVSNAI
jgi:hypothetical protein